MKYTDDTTNRAITAICSAAKARASSDEELAELVSLFGETWAKCVQEHVHGPIETLVYARMEQDYVDYLRVRGRHPAGMTGVGDAPVDVVSLEDDVGEDEDGEALTRHEITPYPPNAAPRGYADPSIEIELAPAREFAERTVAADPHGQRHQVHADRYNGPTPKEAKAARDSRRAWRGLAFKRGAGALARDARLSPVIARRLNIETHTDPLTGGMDGAGWPDYAPKVVVRGR